MAIRDGDNEEVRLIREVLAGERGDRFMAVLRGQAFRSSVNPADPNPNVALYAQAQHQLISWLENIRRER